MKGFDHFRWRFFLKNCNYNRYFKFLMLDFFLGRSSQTSLMCMLYGCDWHYLYNFLKRTWSRCMAEGVKIPNQHTHYTLTT